MKSIVACFALLSLAPQLAIAQPARDWSRLWGGTTNDYGMGVAVDPAGNVFVAGSSEGPIAGQDNGGVTQSCLTKLTQDGKILWIRLESGPANNEAMDVAVDRQGNAYVTGYTAGSLAGEPFAGLYDLFLIKIAANTEGTSDWTRVWGSSGLDTGYGVAVDAADHIYVAGYASGTIDDQPFAGRSDLCLTKYSPDGKRLWTRLLGSAFLDWAQDVVCDAEGEVYLVGYTEGSFDQQVNHGGRDACLVQYSAAGDRHWSRIFGSTSRDEGYGVAVDRAGHVYATGFASSFNGQTVVGDWRDNDAFLISYDRDGTLRWTRLWGSTAGDVGYGVGVDHTGRVLVAGHAPNNLPFDPPSGPGLQSRYTIGTQFLTEFNTDGDKAGSQTWGSTNCSAEALGWDGASHLYVAGYAFDGFDGQVSNGHNDHCLTRWTLAPTPGISGLRVSGLSRLPHFNLEATAGVDRVDYAVNGTVIGTVYGPPWNFTPDPAEMVGTAGLALGANAVVATAYGSTGDLVASAESQWQSWFDGIPTAVRIDEPTPGYTIYTDDLVSPAHTMALRVYAAYTRFWLEEGPMGGSTMRDHPEPLADGGFELRVSVDGVYLASSTTGLEHDPFYHEFDYTSTGLDLGTHRISVHLVPPEGYSHAWDSEHFTVERRQPDLQVGRSVTRTGNYFDVTLTIRNVGSALARLHWLEETMTGFQGCSPTSTMSLTGTTWEFDPAQRSCRGHLDFGSPVILPGENRTVSYRAVPILFRNDCEYVFGGDGGIGYSDADGMGRIESLPLTTTYTSPRPSRRSIADAVTAAGQASDYLAITDPVKLANAHSVEAMSAILTDMAELASLRNGVLGLHHSAGMILSAFRPGDLAGVGQSFRTSDTKEQLFVGHLDSDQVFCYAETTELTLDDEELPISIDLCAGDALALGNTQNRYLQLTNEHTRAEVVVAWGDGHAASDRGKIFSYQIDYDTNHLDHFEVRQFNAGFNSGDALAVAEVWSNPLHPAFDDIIVAGTDGHIRVYTSTGMSLTDFPSAFATGDLFAVGELIDDGIGGPEVEMVVGDVSADALKIYVGRQAAAADLPTHTREVELAMTLDTEDGLVLGDFMGDPCDEIAVADASEDRIVIYGYDDAHAALTEFARFGYEYDADDELRAGYFNARDREQLLILRGNEIYGRAVGTVEIISHFQGENPGDRWALDDLINVGGRWAEALAPGWTDDGYLLLVGETEIIPTFSKDWNISDWGSAGGRVDYTDRNYASTDSDRDNNRPELAVGRIPGNSAERICKTLRTAIEVARNPELLHTGSACCVSGSDEEDEHRLAPHRRDIAGRLSDRGFTVAQHHAPSAATFATSALDQDILFFTPHGNPWGTCGIESNDILTLFEPGTARPLVYASSCLTGRYPAGAGTFGEQFLWKGAVAYIGATERTWHVSSPGLDVCGWGPRFTEAFFSRLEAGRTLGRTLTLAKHHRLSGSANTYSWDWNRNRYHCAIYHFLGDPKLEIAYLSPLQPMDLDDPEEPVPLPGPLSQLNLDIPMYTVTQSANGDRVEIPGGGSVWVPGQPEVPSWVSTVHFPAGYVVQGIELQARSGELTSSGLNLPATYVYQGGGDPAPQPQGDEESWWPDRDFNWSLEEQPDGSTILGIQAYPFFYNSASTESRFYSNIVFGITFAESTVEIARLTTDRKVYPPKASVHIDLRLQQRGPEPANLAVALTLLDAASTVVATLPERALTHFTGRAVVPLAWDPSGFPAGDYELQAVLKKPNNVILDRRVTEFRLGQASGHIAGFTVTPPDYQPGDTVRLSVTFDNSGTVDLDGSLRILVQDAAGTPVTEFPSEFHDVPAGGSFTLDAEWPAAPLHPRNCRFVIYAEFDGQTTLLQTVADWSTAPLVWDSIQSATGVVDLGWWSVAGRYYAIEFTPDLEQIPFAPVAEGLEATPPRNSTRLEAPDSTGYYRLIEWR